MPHSVTFMLYSFVCTIPSSDTQQVNVDSFGMHDQGRRNSIISGEAAQVKERRRGEISKNYFSQPLKSGEADASPASPVPRPLILRLRSKNI